MRYLQQYGVAVRGTCHTNFLPGVQHSPSGHHSARKGSTTRKNKAMERGYNHTRAWHNGHHQRG
jgi:hypothetical protein